MMGEGCGGWLEILQKGREEDRGDYADGFPGDGC